MGASIEAVASYTPADPGAEGSRDIAAAAARRCLENAGRCAEDVEILINTGIYRDENICEPAIAPFIQRSIGANASFPTAAGRGTFAFDLANGGCGAVNALQVLSGFIDSGSARCGMVVTSDVDPTPNVSRNFAFRPVGAAVLLGPGREGEGFCEFHFETFAGFRDLYSGDLRWTGDLKSQIGDRHAVEIREAPGYRDACAGCAADALPRFLATLGMTTADLDLVIPSHAPRGFPRLFASRAGLRTDRVVDVTERAGCVLTAGTALALEEAVVSERFDAARNVLFASVGAGLSVAFALYRRNAGARTTARWV